MRTEQTAQDRHGSEQRWIERTEEGLAEAVTRREAAAAAPKQERRVELALADQVLAERRELAITAAKLSPPDYIRKELGERPSDPQKRKAWDRGVAGIEGYRQENGIKDRDSALGKEPLGGIERSNWNEQRFRLAEQQRTLGLQRGHEAAQELDFGMEMGL